MTIRAAVYSRLNGYAGLTALVSSRIYPKRAPQDQPDPYVIYEQVSKRRPHAMGSDADTAIPRFQVTAWAPTMADAEAVAEQVRAALQRYRGTQASVVIQDTLPENEVDLFDQETGRYGVLQDFFIPHTE